MADLNNLPCCGPVETARLKELPHAHGFDFDLHQCLACGRTWIYAWSSAAGAGAWEWTSESDAEQMLAAHGAELQTVVRNWAARFQ
jgi:hypothetical protein